MYLVLFSILGLEEKQKNLTKRIEELTNLLASVEKLSKPSMVHSNQNEIISCLTSYFREFIIL